MAVGNTRRVIVAGAIGNVLEWYDFAIYGYFAVSIGHTFFPEGDPVAQVLAAFGVFWGFGFDWILDLWSWAALGPSADASSFAAYVVAGIWVVQLLWSPLWLARFQYGPAEWAWRSLTYGRLQALRRPAATPSNQVLE